MITATLASRGPMASTPAEMVLAVAVTFFFVNCVATEANSFLYFCARSGVINSVALSIAVVGLGQELTPERAGAVHPYGREGARPRGATLKVFSRGQPNGLDARHQET